jgi:uncharacterized membrane protein YjjP (DUF1212 family)
MDYDLLLEGCCEVGCRLLGCGAEIYRVEDTVRRLLAAYGLSGEVFAIPNCLIVSVTDDQGHIHTRMRRAGMSSTDIENLERYNALSRRLCADPPADPGVLLAEARRIGDGVRHYPVWLQLAAYFVGAFFFTLFFSGGLADAVVGGLAGMLSGLTLVGLGQLRTNFFINTMAAAFVLGFVAYGLLTMGAPVNIRVVIAGSIMVLVPGLVFTNFMSNLLIGDIVAGLSTFTRAVLSAGAIALGTGAAVALCQRLWQVPAGSDLEVAYPAAVYCLFAFLGCSGFCVLYNVRGWAGAALCCLGGALGWMVYLAAQPLVHGNVYLSSLAAAVVVAAYAELMARVRKYPATSYLLVSFFPLVPGLTIYQAMSYGISGDTQPFLEHFIRTFGISGCLALGALLVSTALRAAHRVRRA